VLPGPKPRSTPRPRATPSPDPFPGLRFGEWRENWIGLFLRIRHIRNAVRLASFRQRDPRISQACVVFPLLGVVRFLRQCCAPGGRFPCSLALGSHLVLPHFDDHSLTSCIMRSPRTASRGLSLFLAEEKIAEAGNTLASPPACCRGCTEDDPRCRPNKRPPSGAPSGGRYDSDSPRGAA
jgi:hypothetical protein